MKADAPIAASRSRSANASGAARVSSDRDVDSSRGEILVISEGDPVGEGICAALAPIRADCILLDSVDAVEGHLSDRVLAIVWSSIGRERGFGRSFSRLQEHEGLPIYAVASDEAPDALMRGLYRAGAAGVFAWPREALLLARYLAEMLSLRLVRGPARSSDVALARSVRAHLRPLALSRTPLDVEVWDGRVHLCGRVDRLADRDEIERSVETIPGVMSLDVSDVRVDAEPVADARLRSACRRVVSAQIGGRTVSVHVRNGHVRFVGTVEDRRQADALRELTAQVPGVCEIEMNITTSTLEARRARAAQKRLAGLLGALHPELKLQVAYHGRVAVLDGQAPTLRVKRSIQRLLERDPAVTRVVNKIEVR
jgi:osmotically-inducible protein OsmY